MPLSRSEARKLLECSDIEAEIFKNHGHSQSEYDWMVFESLASNGENGENVEYSSLGLGHNAYDEIRHDLEEQDDFITNPLEIQEGVLECPKCHGRRTISFVRQERSGDEALVVRAVCVKDGCGHAWRQN